MVVCLHCILRILLPTLYTVFAILPAWVLLGIFAQLSYFSIRPALPIFKGKKFATSGMQTLNCYYIKSLFGHAVIIFSAIFRSIDESVHYVKCNSIWEGALTRVTKMQISLDKLIDRK